MPRWTLDVISAPLRLALVSLVVGATLGGIALVWGGIRQRRAIRQMVARYKFGQRS